MKRNLSKKEEESAFRRKNQQDGNPDRKGKAINVKTESIMDRSTYSSLYSAYLEMHEEKKEGKKDACYNKVKSRYSVWPSAYASGALVKCRQKGAKNWGNSSKKEEYEYMSEAQIRVAECWKGYKRVKGRPAGSPGSCTKA